MLLHGAARSTHFSAVWLVLCWPVVGGGVLPTAAGQGACCGQLRVSVRAETSHRSEGRPIAGVRVELYPVRPGPGLAFETDHKGFGVHIGLPVGTYRVRFTHPDFATVEVTEVVLYTWPTVELHVHLPPRTSGRVHFIRQKRYWPPLIDKESASIRYVIRN